MEKNVKPKSYYAYYLVGEKKSGIVNTWAECESLIRGKFNKNKKFKTELQALEWLKEQTGETLELFSSEVQGKNENSNEKTIFFDSGTGRGVGVEISVASSNGEPLLPQIIPKRFLNAFGHYVIPTIKEATNNYGELLACFFALKFALKNDDYTIIYGDSTLVLEYWSKGFAKKTLPKSTLNLSFLVTKMRGEFERKGGKLDHISGDYNPADLGFHK